MTYARAVTTTSKINAAGLLSLATSSSSDDVLEADRERRSVLSAAVGNVCVEWRLKIERLELDELFDMVRSWVVSRNR